MTERRLVRSLARCYVPLVATVGAAVVVTAALTVIRDDRYTWLLLAALTWASSSFAIKIPAVNATIYISETFVFAMVVLFGAAPATLTVAVDGLLISARRRAGRPERYLFNGAEPAISLWVAATVFFWVVGDPPFAYRQAPPQIGSLIAPVLAMGVVHFLMNTWLTALALGIETGTPPHRLWQNHFMLLGLNSLGMASLALLMVVNVPGFMVADIGHLTDPATLGGLGVIVPLLLLSYLTFRTSVARVEDANRHLTELNQLYLSTVETLAMAIDAKDQITHGHIRRVQHYAVRLARALGVTDNLQVKAIEAAALLHDMGKLSVPEFILNKPGKLTETEYARIKLHAPVGASILSQINFPYPVVPIVRHHHESWDGTGYPDGIAGDEIPVGARIMAVVDCYDALTSDRPYRPALTHDEALAIIRERRGSMYDPAVVDAFLDICHDGSPVEPESEQDRARHALIHQARASFPLPVEERSTRAMDEAASAADAILLLCDTADGLAGRATLDDVAEVMGRHLKRMVPAPLVVFYLVDERTGDLVAAHTSGFGEHRLTNLRIPLGHGLSGWVAANRTTILNSNPTLDLGTLLSGLTPRLESALAAPLVNEGELVGVLSLYAATRDAFTSEHRRLVELVARQIAGALARAASFERDRAALRDAATGLPNEQSLRHLLAAGRLLDTQPSLSFGVLSVGVESENGNRSTLPADADTLLRRVAAATRRALRATDLVFRFSEQELVILMPDTDPEATRQIAGRILDSLGEEAPAGWDAFVRLGLAFAPGDGRTLDELLVSARNRLTRPLWTDRRTPADIIRRAGGH